MLTRKPSRPKKIKLPKHLQHIDPHAAGIDAGSRSHFVALPEGSCEQPVQEFSSLTDDPHRMADWLLCCWVTTVAMESTGIYWIPVTENLESRGREVRLVNARHVKNVPGRKSDALDCQWLQRLHRVVIGNLAHARKVNCGISEIFLGKRQVQLTAVFIYIEKVSRLKPTSKSCRIIYRFTNFTKLRH